MFENKEITKEDIEEIKYLFKELKDMISIARKKDEDVFLADLNVKNIASKIKYVEATKKVKDLRNVKDMISNAKKELPDMD